MSRPSQFQHSQYFEAILQLRDVSEEVIEFAKQEIKKHQNSIAKIKHHDNGIDFYLADKDLTRNVGKKLQTHFGGQCLITAKLFTKRKDGQEIYRITVLFRGLPFQKGEIVTYQDEKFEVESLNREIILRNKKNNQKISFKYRERDKIRKIRPILTEE